MNTTRRVSLCSWLLVMTLLLSACAEDLNYPYGVFSETVTPFEDANSPYDDLAVAFDACLPKPVFYEDPYCRFPFYLSSNRETQGGSFDITTMSGLRGFDTYRGGLNMSAWVPSYDPDIPVWTTTTSPANEYAPFILNDAGGKLYFHAGDAGGNLDIYYTTTSVADVPVTAINSTGNDVGITFANGAFYFASNRGGDFDLYSAALPVGADISTWLKGAAVAPTNLALLNSAANDECPSMQGNVLVFTSDRPGGYGGYDLYYAIYQVTGWSAPVNFGPAINSASDERCPIVVSDPDYLNDLLVFSSDRPGGAGGFDFYYVGIAKRVQ